MRIIMHGHHADTLFSHLPSLEERQEAVRKNKRPTTRWNCGWR